MNNFHLITLKDPKIEPIITEIEDRLKKILKNKLIKIILYGSYAGREQKKWSDMDIMVLVDIDEESIKNHEKAVNEANFDILMKYSKDVSIIIENYKKYMDYTEYIPFYENVEKEGIVIYG